MKNFTILFILILILSGCSDNAGRSVTSKPEFNIDANSLNQILLSFGLLGKNIYDADSRVTEAEAARNKSFIIPDGYELALDVKYATNEATTTYNIKALRQIEKQLTNEDIEPWGDYDPITRMPEKPLLVAIVDKDIIKNLFVVRNFSVLDGSLGYGDYDLEKIAKAVEIKDLNNDNTPEILIRTYKGYTADSEHGMVTIYFDSQKNIFATADEVFRTTWKEAYDVVEIKKISYVLKAEPGSGNCRVCNTPYLVRIYQFSGNSYFDIGSVGVENEYESGRDAIKDALPRAKEKILTGNVFTL